MDDIGCPAVKGSQAQRVCHNVFAKALLRPSKPKCPLN